VHYKLRDKINFKIIVFDKLTVDHRCC